MATLASSTAAAAGDLSALSQITAKAVDQLSTVLESTEVGCSAVCLVWYRHAVRSIRESDEASKFPR